MSFNKRPQSKEQIIIILSLILVLVATVFLGISTMKAPEHNGQKVADSEFSAVRAREHLQNLTKEHRTMGAPGHDRARDYIINQIRALELEPELQRTTSVTQMEEGFIKAATVENIIVKLEGTNNSKSLMLAGHYDSVPWSKGANDDGSAVVTMLETLRALKASDKLKNDVIFLFTDCEEQGLLGARAFMKEHRLASEVGIVLNFEARGKDGPVVMFQTSRNNGWLMKEFITGVPYPVAYSFFGEIFKLSPFDSDFTVFEKKNLSGLNFAYANNSYVYHSPLDNIENISLDSLQHHGSYALNLAKHFGKLNLEEIKGEDRVFFNLLGKQIISYPVSWSIPLTFFLVALFVLFIIITIKNHQLSWIRWLFSIIYFVLSLFIIFIAIKIIWGFTEGSIDSVNYLLKYNTDFSDFYLLGFVLLTIAIIIFIYSWFKESNHPSKVISNNRKISLFNPAIGGLTCWVGLTILTVSYLPAASYIFLWPGLFSCAGLILLHYFLRTGNPLRSLIYLFFAIPGVLIFSQVIFAFYIFLGLGAVMLIAILITILSSLLIPQFYFITNKNKRLLSLVSLVMGILFLAVGSFNMYTNQERIPEKNMVCYGYNIETGQAVWITDHQHLDNWERQFFKTGFEAEKPDEFFINESDQFFLVKAPNLALKGPTVEVVKDVKTNQYRSLSLLIKSSRQAPIIKGFIISNEQMEEVKINNNKVESTEFIYYNCPKQGIELTIKLKAEQMLQLRLVDVTYGLPNSPNIDWKERKSTIPNDNSDLTMVTNSFKF